jgi:hypothetical protein
MADTSRIVSGFDVEMQLGGGWFAVALQGLADHGLLIPDPPPPPIPPGAVVVVDEVTVLPDDPDWDLEVAVTISGVSLTITAALQLSADGKELVISTSLPGVGQNLPFDVLSGLAGPPQLTKVAGEDDNDPAIVLLANLDLRTNPQDEDPLPEGEHEPRGDLALARSFLPTGRHLAVGVGRATFPRFASDIWHSELRADDGSHPFPDEEDRKGEWDSVSVTPGSGRIRIVLKGTVPIDSPLIDVIPDGKVTITIDLTPELAGGDLSFSLELDTDIDTGILGDLLAGIGGGIIGFLIGLLAGAALSGLGIGFFAGILVLEIVEFVTGEIIESMVEAKLDDTPAGPVLVCDQDVVVRATPTGDEGGIALGPLQTIPRSVPIHIDRPDELHERRILVTAGYDEATVDGDGMALVANVSITEMFTPLRAALVGRTRDPDTPDEPGPLRSLDYRAADGSTVTLELTEVIQRMSDGAIQPPLRLEELPAEATIHIPGSKLGSVCLRPTAIRRSKTVVTAIRFSTGLDLRVSEAVRLQDAGAIVVRGFQLIHPKNAFPYFRAKPDDSTDNNFEKLPKF